MKVTWTGAALIAELLATASLVVALLGFARWRLRHD